MQIVIDIDDEIIKIAKESPNFYPTYCFESIWKAIHNGVPLPKGHERLIILSEDAVKREQISLSFSCQNWISEVGLSNATVAIIEADTRSEG